MKGYEAAVNCAEGGVDTKLEEAIVFILQPLFKLGQGHGLPTNKQQDHSIPQFFSATTLPQK